MSRLDMIAKARRALKISKKRKEDHVLLLRTCDENLRSYGRFQWPGAGKLVEAPDWDPAPICGNGLHGALWGVGDGALLCEESTSKWLVVAARSDSVVDLVGKVKVPKAFVCFVGTRMEAVNWLVINSNVDLSDKEVIGLDKLGEHGSVLSVGYSRLAFVGDYGKAVAGMYGTAVAGRHGRASAGSSGKAIAGKYGNATSGGSGKSIVGDNGTAIAGSHSVAVAGIHGKAVAGNHGKAVAGKQGTATVGDYGHAIAGFNGKAVAGSHGTAVAGNQGIAIVGYKGDATVGHKGKAKAGIGGVIRVGWVQHSYSSRLRNRWAVGYVGEEGIEADIYYRVVRGKLVKCD